MTKEELQKKNKDYYEKNKEYLKEKQRERNKYKDKNKENARLRDYYSLNKGKIIKRTRSYTLNWIDKNAEKKILYFTKARAKRDGIYFDLVLEDIFIPVKCPYLDVFLTNVQGSGRQPTNASIDRIDNSKGYIKGNIQIISEMANRMKQNATIDQLITFAKGVLKLHGGS